MKPLLLRSLAALMCLGVFSSLQTYAAARPNFAGSWRLERRGTTSLRPLMQQIGAPLHQRKLADAINLTATIQQTDRVMTVATRGPGFSLDETLHLNGRAEPSNLNLFGATSHRTRNAWSRDGNQVVTTHYIRTRQGQEGQLIVTRFLTNQGRNLVVDFTLRLQGANPTTARQTWRRRA